MLAQRRFGFRSVLVAAGLVLLGWLVLAVTVDRVLATGAPGLALFWNPGSADANTALADQLAARAAPDSAAAVRAAPAIRARAWRALQRQPVDAGAARLLGLGWAATGQTARAARLFGYAEAMSRRDLPLELILIQNSVNKGDVVGALGHYDRAMRTVPTSWPVLFPVLTRAADAPGIWRPLGEYLAHQPPWARPFLQQYLPQSQSAPALWGLARRLGFDRRPSTASDLLGATERRLADLGAYRAAADLYARNHGLPAGFTGAGLRNGGFEQPGGSDPFDWTLTDEPDLAAERQPSPVAGGGTALYLSAINGRGGDLATQLVLLPPGRYRIRAEVGAVGGDRLAYPELLVRCADGRELLRQPFPSAPARGIGWQVAFAVPAACPAQRIVLRARSPLETSNDTPWIDNLSVRPEEARS